jgi:hypothetical protein
MTNEPVAANTAQPRFIAQKPRDGAEGAVPQKARTSLGCGGSDFLDVNGLLRRIEIAGKQHMRGREIPDSFRILNNPDGLIPISYKDGSLGFPFRVSHRSASTPAFLHAIRAAGFRVLGSTTLITDPTCPRGVLRMRPQRGECHEPASKQENKNNPASDHSFLLLPPPASRPWHSS